MHFLVRLFICGFSTYGASVLLPRLSPSVHHSAFTLPMDGAGMQVSYLLVACLLVAGLSMIATSGKKSR